MKKHFIYLQYCLIALIFGSQVEALAQDSCTYQLRLVDTEGDGWDDSQLYVRLGNAAERAYTHEGAGNIRRDSIRLFNLRVKSGDTIVLRYEPQGDFQEEVAFSLINNAGETVFTSEPLPRAGVVFAGRTRCVTCGMPLDVTASAVRSADATIRWRPSVIGSRATYRIEWDTIRRLAGQSRNFTTTTDTFVFITGLVPEKTYFYYMRTLCAGNDTSGWVGPLSFVTDTALDLGIVNILTPINRCDLTVDSVKVQIKNFGGEPQALFEFKYAINGRKAPVTPPSDGLYTNVISKDSTETIAFKTLADFSNPGEYLIEAWTELKNDRNNKNDTFKLTVTRPAIISTYPYTQNFENGKGTWAVIDTLGRSSWELSNPRYRYIQGAFGGTRSWTTLADSSYRDSDTSYLLSPCFNFSQLTADPRINFALNFYTEPNFDGLWLEGSTDGGKTWSKVGRRGSGINWYNDTLNRQRFDLWTGDKVLGWKQAQHVLEGMAGKPSCRVRFVFRSDRSTNILFDGAAIDNITVSPIPAADLGIDSVARADLSDCGNLSDSIVVRLVNLGSTTQSNFIIGYQLDNGAIVRDTVTNVPVQPNRSILYKVRKPLNTQAGIGTHSIKVWQTTLGDTFRLNDTAVINYLISPPTAKSASFNFDDGIPPQYWTGRRVGIGRGRHGNAAGNGYLFANLYQDTAAIPNPLTRVFDATTNKFGVIKADDSLSYDYRFVNELSPFSGYDLVNSDTLKVLVSRECDTTFTTIDIVNRSLHNPTTVYRMRKVSLRPFAGQIIKVRFLVTSRIQSFTGYFFDLDNVNYINICPANFGVQATVNNATGTVNNGRIIVRPTRGAAPYRYVWNNGFTRDTLTNLAPGNYSVTITDNNGCTETQSFTISRIVKIFDSESPINNISLFPNPANDKIFLDIQLSKDIDVRVQLLNSLGQLLEQRVSRQNNHPLFEFNISQLPTGVYFARIAVGDKIHTAKFMKR